MANRRQRDGELVAVPPSQLEVLPPQTGVVGEFLTATENMFRARVMRMKALFGRINDTGQHLEALLRMAAESMQAAEEQLSEDLRKQGLISENDAEEEGAQNDL